MTVSPPKPPGIARWLDLMRLGPQNLAIIRSSTYLLVFLGVAKISGAAKEIVIASAYGTSALVDAYALQTALAGWPVALFTMTSGVVFIPLLVRLSRTDAERARAVFRTLLGWASVFGLVCAAGCGALFWLFSARLGYHSAFRQMGLLVAATIPFGILSAVLAARLLAARRQVGTLLEAVTPLVIIAAIAALSGWLDGTLVLGFGTLAGFVLATFALAYAQGGAASGLLPNLAGSRDLASQIGTAMLIALAAQMIFSLGGTVLDQIVAAQLSPGANAIVNYTNKALTLVTSIAGIVVGRAVLPVLSEAALSGSAAATRLAQGWSLTALLLGTVLGALLFINADLVIGLLYERGEFSRGDVAAVSRALRAGIGQLPFLFGSLVLAQWIASLRRFDLLLLANVAAVACKVAMLAIFIGSAGIEAIFYATTAMYMTSFGVLALFAFRRQPITGRDR